MKCVIQIQHSKSLASHKDRLFNLFKNFRVLHFVIYKVVESYIKSCENCQKQGD